METAAAKRELRARLLQARRAHPPGADQAREAAARVANRPEFEAARAVALHASLPDELSSEPLVRRALASGKRVALPRIADDGRLVFAWIDAFEDLRPGRYGVREPAEASAPVALAEVELVVVPGVAFDRTGGRLGRGGGHYDRALAVVRGPGPLLVGYAAARQVVESVPMEELDRRVDVVATEAEWISCSGARTSREGCTETGASRQ